MKSAIFRTLAISALAFATVTPAAAAVITKTFNFSASNFSGAAPISPATGSFTLTWDTAQNYANSISGLVVNSFNLPQAGPVGFDYSANSSSIIFGGTLNNVNTIYGGTADFFMVLGNILTNAPTYNFLTYSVAGGNAFHQSETGSVTSAAAVPEPTTWAMLLFGLGVIGSAMRRRHRNRRVSFA